VLLKHGCSPVFSCLHNFRSNRDHPVDSPVLLNFLYCSESQSRDKSVPLLNSVASPSGLDHNCCNMFPLLEHFETDQHLHLGFVKTRTYQLILVSLTEVKSLFFPIFFVNRNFALHVSNLGFDSGLAEVILLFPFVMPL